MKKFWLSLIFIAWASIAHAQMNSFFPGPGIGKAAGASYTGPGDLVSFKAWYGLRAYSAAVRGTKIANVCNSTGGTDVACADMLSDATTGALVAATIGGITCPGANCTIKTWYDQTAGSNCTGSCDVVQTTVASRFALVANALGTLPGAQSSNASQTGMASAGSISQAQPLSFSAVVERTSGSSLVFSITDSGLHDALAFDGVNTGALWGGTAAGDFAMTDSAAHALQGLLNGASSSANVDGSTLSPSTNPGTSSMSSALNLSVPASGFSMTGFIFEAGVAAGDQSTSFTSLCHNQRLYWGTGGTC